MIFLDLRVDPSHAMNDRFILNSRDFFNKESEILINDFGLHIHELSKDFIELCEEKKLSNFSIKIEDLNSPINFYFRLARKFASSAVIHYELVHREELYFPHEKGLFHVRDLFGPDFQMKVARRDDFTAYELRERQFNYLNALLR
ncbi:MAG: hypothetical protein NUV46_02555 [Nanoarchaeota archaeon]|nr:hypothetical protein [Nanoarchaeota archaeon]